MSMSSSPDRHYTLEFENDEECKKPNMEYDLRTTEWMLAKVRNSDLYAQHLYAAMCNNTFRKNEVISILKEDNWSCSWRHSGGIIADMQQKGDYMDWYCTGRGLGGDFEDFIDEGIVSDEVRADLFTLGWLILEYK